jgi:hypothetical protein
MITRGGYIEKPHHDCHHFTHIHHAQLLGAYEKGWVADKTFALELQRLLV